jgi:hypothetical protein
MEVRSATSVGVTVRMPYSRYAVLFSVRWPNLWKLLHQLRHAFVRLPVAGFRSCPAFLPSAARRSESGMETSTFEVAAERECVIRRVPVSPAGR